ncbi:MAG: Ku-like_protein [uncultured Solirubrobacteraceae bacterium]|uniref:Non-homologous end joining protein Ku n=1 Tax=uncultured Solirubrobacteraceae bacterium TaxID=1162706 RepID=A0A6J4SGW0_9ACTN|nr:MAG: Ku-like_protein [uncultured Solirubrobacteraceae bacterium]
MPRAIWTGAISFGLVTVPVKLYAAVQSKTVKFNQLDADDHSRIAMKRTNAQTGEEVPYERIVKGFEISPDRYVIVEPGELEALDPKKTKTIDIEGFVELDQVDPIYFDHPYYLVPGTGGAKPYRLLCDAMAETGRVGIAKVVIRSKQQLVALRPMGDVLAMSTMNFHDEIVDAGGLDEVPTREDVDSRPRELEMAKQLVDSLAEPWEPEKYEDTYREQILALIERKAAGEEITVQPAEKADTSPVPDLMSALKASLDAVRDRGGDAPATGRKPAVKPEAAEKKAGTSRKSDAKQATADDGGAPAKKPAARKPAAKKPAAAKK